jgi:murein DD-endopeptidase MepM/ murein hydrolase activator NlpD
MTEGHMKANKISIRSFLMLVATLASLGIASSLAHAQSLADVAKKEAERRQAIKAPVKTYTNNDLVPVPPPTSDSGKATTPAASPAPGDADKKAADGKDAKDKKDDKGPEKDQKYWSARMKELRTQLERDQSFADALQSKINGLTADFSARDDPAQRAQIGRDRQKALDEQNRLKQAIVNDQKAISDLEEEARRAGVPSGWLRS